MYKEFYNFKAMPFAQNFDQKFIFLSENYETPLALLVSGLDKGVKLHAVIGDEGVGKSTFINYVYQHIQHHCHAAFISKGLDSSTSLLQSVVESFAEKPSSSIFELLEQLKLATEKAYKKNRELPSLLIIDDADKMNAGTFKAVDQLLKLNKEKKPLLQLILVGNNDLLTMLDNYQQGLNSDYVEIVKTNLKPLKTQETKNYINHRIKVAGSTNEHLFNQHTCALIHTLSQGVPKKINGLCDHALSLASTQKVKQISPNLVKQLTVLGAKTVVNKEVVSKKNSQQDSKNLQFNKTRNYKIPTAAVASCIVAILIVYLYPFTREPENLSVSETLAKAKTEHIHEEKIKNSKTTSFSSQTVVVSQAQQIENLQHKVDSLIGNQQQLKVAKNNAQKTQIDKWLAKAEQQLSESKLLTPPEENAFETYTEILSIVADEKRAIQGLRRIADRYLTLAKRKYKQGQLLRSKTLISRGLKANPQHKKLVALNAEIQNRLAFEEKQNLIQPYLLQANQQLDSLNLIEPNGNNAYQSYANILAIDNKNKEAHQGIDKIQTLLTAQMNKAIVQQNYKLARRLARKILAAPHRESFLQKATIAANKTEQLVTRKITTLLSLAEQQIKSQLFLTPKGNNAAETYRSVLVFDQDNVTAKKGLMKMISQYQFLANSALSTGKNKQALAYVNQALQSFPYNDNLLELQNKISIAMSEEQIHMAGAINSENRTMEIKKQLRPFGNF